RGARPGRPARARLHARSVGRLPGEPRHRPHRVRPRPHPHPRPRLPGGGRRRRRREVAVRLTRVRLRNYRVYEDLDLELPPGLIGVYGANGAGKSTLMEAIRFTLYGRARTANDEIRTSGVN